jgi:RimJ/RimL family protein N-acetyltransferase
VADADAKMVDVTVDPATAAAEAASVHVVAAAERRAVVDALARAFFDDPVVGWFFPDEARRMGQLQRLWMYLGEKDWFTHDLTFTTAAVAGAAVWIPPDRWRIGILQQLRLTPGVISGIGLRDFPRALRGFNLMESEHPRTPPHYYLPQIGVVPEWQGRGLGTALLQPMLERCDRERIPAYLEASTPRSRACYERNGFVVTGEFTFPDGPTQWPMWREPGAG